MKKLLALVLALVMSMSLVTISNAAFKDADKISNKEAVDVMAAVGVLAGYDNGEFGATDTLTRAQACKIIAYLDLGGKTADAIKGTGTVFTDVKATSWYAGYVEYCAGAGYVAGVGGGKFDPEAKVTGVQFAKMLLCALGYKAEIEGYTGTDYTIAVARDANKNDLFDGLSIVTSANLTREQAAQMAFNALEATVVEYQGGTNVTTSDGTSVIVNATRNEVKESKYDYTAVNGKSTKDSDGVQQLCEKLYQDKLIKTTGESDDFGRPSTKWIYDKDTTVTASDAAVAVYAGADYDKDTTKDLKDDYKNGINKVVYNGGEDKKVTVSFLEKSINGLTIEIYEDPKDDDGLIAVVIEGYVAQIDTIETNDKDVVKKVTFTVYEATTSESITIDAKDDEDAYAMIKGLDEDDYFVAFLKPGWDTSKKASDLLAVDSVKAVEGKVTAMSADTYYNGWIKIDGVKYEFANEYSQEIELADEGTYYLYNGYVIHSDKEANKADDQFLYVVRGGNESDKFGGKTYYAEVVFTDGTAKTVEIDKVNKASAEPKAGLYTYTYSEKNDNYKLTSKDLDSVEAKLVKGKTAVTANVTGNAKTIYVSVKLDSGKFDSATVYTGYKAVKSMSGNAYMDTDKGTAKVVYILNATSVADNSDLVYVAGKSVSGEVVKDDDLGNYYTYNAIVDGKIVEIMVDEDLGAKLDGLYNESATNDDDVYTELKANKVDETKVTGVNFKKAADEVIKIEKGEDSTSLAYADDVNVYVISTKGEITTGSINRNYSNVDITYTTNDDGEVTNLYIVKLA